ncbi:MazG nucleotide pyrophosphohydrolase domain-containing protein [Nanoarchaeota archaeon]
MEKAFENLVNLMGELRGENGCSWDKEQSFETIKKCVINEADEVTKAIENKDYNNLKEELGDLLWNVIFMSKIAEEKGLFDIKDAMEHVKNKIVQRHPHVFGDEKIDDPEKANARWNEIKEEEK